MSNPSPDLSPEPSDAKALTSALGWVGVILLFALIVFIAYLPNRPPPVDHAVVEARLSTLAELRAREHSLLHSYAWVDASSGVVRIPIERAMELTVARISPLSQAPAGPAAESPRLP